MIERVVSLTWSAAALGLIFVTALLAMMLIHRAVFQSLAGSFIPAGECLIAATLLGVGAILLSKHRTDLV